MHSLDANKKWSHDDSMMRPFLVYIYKSKRERKKKKKTLFDLKIPAIKQTVLNQ